MSNKVDELITAYMVAAWLLMTDREPVLRPAVVLQQDFRLNRERLPRSWEHRATC